MKRYTTKSWKELPSNLVFNYNSLEIVAGKWVVEVWKKGKCTRYILPKFICDAFDSMKDLGRKEKVKEIQTVLGMR